MSLTNLLTRREQMLVACVLLAFGVGLGVRHWRGIQTLAPLNALDVQNTGGQAHHD